VQLLGEPRLQERVLRHILQKAAKGLELTSYRLGPNAHGWSSGHHPQVEGPESWSTASVYHFAHVSERLLAEQIRRSTFEYLNVPYTPPAPSKYVNPLNDRFLDCEIQLDGQ
jgi:hypothetical protein